MGLVALVVLSIAIDAVLYSDKIHAGVTIAGRDMSGLTRDEAAATLGNYIAEAQGRSVKLVSDQKTWEVSPDSVGVTVDIEGTVSAAMGATRDSNFIVDLARKLKLYFSGPDIPLSGTVDDAGLAAVLDEVAAEIDVPAVNAGVAIDGGAVEEIQAQDGLVVDRAALGEQLTLALFRLESTELPVPIIVDEPEIKAEHVATALAQTKTMVSGPLKLTSGAQSWNFSARQVAGFIDFKSEDVGGVSTLVPYLSAKKMASTFRQVSQQMSITPIDAYFAGDDEKAWVVPSVPGRVLKPEETAEALNAAALKTTGRTAEAVVRAKEADFTTEEAEAMGIKDLLSVRTTEWIGTKNRQTNVRITTEFVNQEGKCYLAPGEEFSFLKTVGERTEERGYKLAPGIQPNGELDDVYGGGICQVATTLFNSVFFAGLKVTERRNHTIYISHYPEGRDAAAAGDEVDLKFVNDTQHYIWIRGESDGIRTTFWIYGTSDGRKVTFKNSGIMNEGPPPPVEIWSDPKLSPGVTVVASPGQSYKMVVVTRWITWPDGKVTEEKFTSKYPQRPVVIKQGPAVPTTAPPTTAAPTP